MPRARDAALGKVAFAVRYCADRPLPRATLGKAFAEGKGLFAERIWPSAKNLVPVVIRVMGAYPLLKLFPFRTRKHESCRLIHTEVATLVRISVAVGILIRIHSKHSD